MALESTPIPEDATPVRVDEALWENSMDPEGVLLSWIAPDGAQVAQGARVAEVLIEGARHEIMADAPGRLTHLLQARDVLAPGAEIGRIAG